MYSRISVAATIFIVAIGLYFVAPWKLVPLPTRPSPNARGFDVTPSDAAARPAVHATMRRLAEYSASPDKIFSGQNVGHTAADLLGSHYRTWARLTRFRDQPAPAVMAFDLGLNQIPQNASPIIKLARPHAEANGLVTLSMHPSNPWTQGEYDDRKHGTFEELMQPEHPAHARWIATLDRTARVLDKLQQNNITVLWRPLHEPNGSRFWWCSGGDEAALTAKQYQQLWLQMHERFTEVHQLHNLIWVYTANAQIADDIAPPMDCYPGDALVDVVGLDYYGPNIADLNKNGSYDEIMQTGKIVALTEFGSRPMDGSLDTNAWAAAMHARHPNFAYFVFWHSWPKNLVSLADLDDVDALMDADWIHHLRDVKPMQ